jgi:hypothetical protein
LDWLMIGGLGIGFAAFLLPTQRRRSSPHASVEEFERSMGLLAETERGTGRWIVAPRKGERFMGHEERIRHRARDRRRRAFLTLLEAIGLTFLIGLFPPLRRMWILTGAMVLVLGGYVCLLVQMKNQERVRAQDADPPEEAEPVVPPTRGLYDDLGSLGPGDLVHVVVRPARELQTAGV